MSTRPHPVTIPAETGPCEVVLNWCNDREACAEIVPVEAITRQTREFPIGELIAMADAMSPIDEPSELVTNWECENTVRFELVPTFRTRCPTRPG